MASPSQGVNNGQPEPTVRALSVEDVRRIATLARLELSEQQVGEYRSQLSAVLDFMERLGQVDVSDVEPMSHPSGAINRLDDDVLRVPGEGLAADALLGMAPATFDRFVSVPKVVGEGAA